MADTTRKGDPWSRFVPRISKADAEQEERNWLVLRHKTRRRIMDVLSQYGGLLCVIELAQVLEEKPSVISNHLAMLRAVKLVSSTNYGAMKYNELNREQLGSYKRFLES